MNGTRRIRLIVVVLSAVGLVCTACGGSDDSGSSDGSEVRQGTAIRPASPTPPARTFDPPVRFDTGGGIALPDVAQEGKVNAAGRVEYPLPVALSGTLAFVGTPYELQVIDTLTGSVRQTVRPDTAPAIDESAAGGALVGSNPAQPPVVADDGDRELVLYPFLTKVPGAGTTPSHLAVELTAIDASTGSRSWATPIDLVGSDDDGSGRDTSVAMVGVADGVAIFAAAAATYAVDLTTRRLLWTRAGFVGAVVTGASVVGRYGDNFSFYPGALAVRTGAPLWRSETKDSALVVMPGGPKAVVVTGKNYASGQSFVQLVDPATGAVRDDGEADYTNVRCVYDERSVTVCAKNGWGDPWAAAFDAVTLKWLWTLPDTKSGRVAPDLTTAWHGAVYGTTENGPVVLDARTGADREQSPGAAPHVVDGAVGITLIEGKPGLHVATAVG